MAARLREAVHDVHLLARGERVADLKEHGIVIRSVNRSFSRRQTVREAGECTDREGEHGLSRTQTPRRHRRGDPRTDRVPQLIVVGEHEYFLLRKKAKEWDKRLPNSEFTTVPDADHIANHDNSTAVNEILFSFLETVD